jgi:hypothetical protein
MNVAWFSTGVSSAVAIKLAIDEIDQIIYTHIDDQHPDSMRFLHDCEEWFGREITVLQSPYKNVETAVLMAGGKGYINGVAGASCTRYLKKRVRKEWEQEQAQPLTYFWGLDSGEQHRADRLYQSMPKQEHRFPLIERKMNKAMAHEVLRASKIKRPAMYSLGYHNNNCVGCVKGGMGYWNKIRVDFPEVFAARAALERKVGATCINGAYLDELAPEAGRHAGPIVDSCGIMCELMAI